VLDVSDIVFERSGDVLIVAFTRTLSIHTILRLPAPIWIIHRAGLPSMGGEDWVIGVKGVVEDAAAARAVVQASGLTRPTMPADVQAWLS
jgi:hypothetical protein